MVALCDADEGAFRIGRLLGLDENAEMLAPVDESSVLAIAGERGIARSTPSWAPA